jgi:hypothetical protein
LRRRRCHTLSNSLNSTSGERQYLKEAEFFLAGISLALPVPERTSISSLWNTGCPCHTGEQRTGKYFDLPGAGASQALAGLGTAT